MSKGTFISGAIAVTVVTATMGVLHKNARENERRYWIGELQTQMYELHDSQSILRAYQIFNDENIKSKVIRVKFDDEFTEGDLFRAYPITYKGETTIVFIVEKVEG